MKPILFNTDMVRAILDGRKTVTRRAIKPKFKSEEAGWNIVTNKHSGEFCYCEYYDEYEESTRRLNPPYFPGDILYVRETWKQATGDPAGGGYALFDTYVYKADGKAKDDYSVDCLMVEDRWHPSIHMPKEAARIFLRVTSVRAERLHNMSTSDAEAEGAETDEWLDLCEEAGVVGLSTCTLREYFGYHIWDRTINGVDNMARYGWDANPWVWVIGFERCEKPQEGKL